MKNNVRRIFLLAVCGVMMLSAATARTKSSRKNDAPPSEFTKKGAYVFDANDIDGNYKDNIRFISNTMDTLLNFSVYAYNPKTEQWFLYGTAFLKKFEDTAFVDTVKRFNLTNYRYFAIVPPEEGQYKYRIYTRHSDIYIAVSDKK